MESKPNPDDRRAWMLVAILGFLAVLLGAFGAHALRDRLEIGLFNAFQTGVTYQFFHVFALALTLLVARLFPEKSFKWVYWAFCLGLFLFSGSLYLYALTGIRAVAMITPIGGVCFLLGWLLLAFRFRR